MGTLCTLQIYIPDGKGYGNLHPHDSKLPADITTDWITHHFCHLESNKKCPFRAIIALEVNLFTSTINTESINHRD